VLRDDPEAIAVEGIGDRRQAGVAATAASCFQERRAARADAGSEQADHEAVDEAHEPILTLQHAWRIRSAPHASRDDYGWTSRGNRLGFDEGEVNCQSSRLPENRAWLVRAGPPHAE